MAKGTGSGIKTFFFLLIALVGSVVLGIGAFLILVPNSNVFGIAYVANVEKILFNNIVKDNQNVNFDMSDYSKIVFQTENTNVKILCGTENASNSNIVLDKNSFGYYLLGSKTDYTYNFYAEGQTLYFILEEPEYSFLKIFGNTNLILNINAFDALMPDIEFDIQTTNGNVTFGGATSVTSAQAYPISARKVQITTLNGSISIDDSVTISSVVNLTTNNGGINFKGNINAEQISLHSLNGNIKAKNFTNNALQLNVEISEGKVTLNEINGNVYLDAINGIFNAKTIKGNFQTSDNITKTIIVVDKIEGTVDIGNIEGNFTVDIKEILGTTSILTAGGNIKINNLQAQANILTTSASVDIVVNETNIGRLIVNTESGNISVNFKNIQKNHQLTTVSGQINVKCSFNCSFYLNAETQYGFINRIWIGEKTTGTVINNFAVGESPTFALDLASTYGNIIVDRYNIAN